MKNCFLFIILIAGFYTSDSQYYVGAGPTYNLMAGESADRNLDAGGVHLEIENRSICWLWFGLHADYISLEPQEEYPLSLPYYNSVFNISPTVRFAPFNLDCNSYDLSPYIKGQLNLGLANNSDELSKLGVGTTFGLGLAYSFNLFDQCWMIDGYLDWESPNNILVAEGRLPLFYYQTGITLSWRLQ